MTDLEKIKKRIDLYELGNIPIHIVTHDDSWLNGFIVKVYDDYFEMIDRVKGQLPIFFADIRILEFFRGDAGLLKQDIEKLTGGNSKKG
jgi:hypothetical protein